MFVIFFLGNRIIFLKSKNHLTSLNIFDFDWVSFTYKVVSYNL